MNPGATTRPSASIVRLAGPLNLPISAIFPFLTETSPRNAGIPEPSTMRPSRIRRSYAIASPFLVTFAINLARRYGDLAPRKRRQGLFSPHGSIRRVGRLPRQGEPVHNLRDRSPGEEPMQE